MDLEALCKAYINDELPPKKRKKLEIRISNGDQEVISILKRLRSFENPARNSDAAPQYVDDSTTDLSSFIPGKEEKGEEVKEEIAAEDLESEPEDTGSKRFGNTMLTIAGGVIGLLVLVLAYIQWQNENMEQHINVLETQLEQARQNVDAKNNRLRSTRQQLDNIIAIMGGNLVEFIPFSGKAEYFDKAVMIWDRSTFRTAMIFPEANLPKNQQYTFWVRNRKNEWNNLGSINKLKQDSLYTNWNASSLTKAVAIHIRLDSIAQKSPSHEGGTLLAEFKLPD